MSSAFKRAIKSINSSTTWAKRGLCCLLAFGLLASAGCSGPATSEENSAAPTASELPMPEQTQSAPVAETDTLRFPLPQNITTFHPLVAQDENLSSMLSLVFEPALKMSATGEFSPSIIESWTVDESGTTFVFTLREGVQFHGDHGVVTSDDLLFCLDTINTLAEEACPWKQYMASVLSYEKIDNTHFRLVATQKTADILFLMTFPVLPKSAYESRSTDSLALPIGTGPYIADAYSAQDGLSLSRNENWWKSPAKFSKITFLPQEDETVQITNYQTGLLDGVPTSLTTANSYSAEGKTTVHSIVTPYYECLIPNMRHEDLQDKQVRQAISLAIDRSSIITTSILGEGIATETPLRPDLSYFEGQNLEVNAYNLAEAQRLLTQAGYIEDPATGFRYKEGEDGEKHWLTIKLLYTESQDFYYRASVANSIKQQLELAGIQVELVEKDAEEYVSLLEAKTFDMALCCFYMRTDNQISFLFSDANNYGEYIDGELSQLLSNTRSALTEEERGKAFSELQRELLDALPQIGLFFRENALILDSDIRITENLRYRYIFADIASWE